MDGNRMCLQRMGNIAASWEKQNQLINQTGKNHAQLDYLQNKIRLLVSKVRLNILRTIEREESGLVAERTTQSIARDLT